MDEQRKGSNAKPTKRQMSNSEEPKPKRAKVETESTKNEKVQSTTVFSVLPVDVLIKVVIKLPISQWPALEKVSRNMRDAVREVSKMEKVFNVHDDFKLKHTEKGGLKSFLGKFLKRSPNVKEISGLVLKLIGSPTR